MKIATKATSALAISLAATLLINPSATAGSKTSVLKPKTAGRSSNTPINTILNGVGAPLASLGINGDFYIDSKNLTMYGPKKSNRWPAAQTLRGSAGANGANGSDGKSGGISNASTVTGAQGLQGPAGPQGPAGDTGPAGATGTTGASGLPGPTGSNGATGATGPSGATGSAGSSKIATVDIAPFNFSTNSTYVDSPTSFGNLLPGKTYWFSIMFTGIADDISTPIGIDLIPNLANASLLYQTQVNAKTTFNGTEQKRYSFLIQGSVTVGGSGMNFKVRLYDGWSITGGSPIQMTGKAWFVSADSSGW